MFAGLAFMSRQIVNSPGFYANRTERQRGIDEPEKEKSMRGSNWYNHKVRRYFGRGIKGKHLRSVSNFERKVCAGFPAVR